MGILAEDIERVRSATYFVAVAGEHIALKRAGRRELSPLEQLEKLEELRQRGVISQAEFDLKKQKLLDRL